MDKIIVIVKELRLLMSLLIATGIVSVSNKELALEYVYTYNIHLALLTAVGIYINHFLSGRRHKISELRLDLYQSELNRLMLEGTISQLKVEVSQASRDYHTIEVIDFSTTIDYLYGLDERRKALPFDPYTEEMMTSLLRKIKLGGGKK